MGKLREIRWTWTSKDSNERTGYMSVDGTVSLEELTEMMQTLAPESTWDTIFLNWATVRWTREATPAELEMRKEQEERHRQRHEKWEREAYARLRKKYGWRRFLGS